MIKRMIECCDFCKKEAELAASIEIKKGKKKGRAYELCITCAEELETRLVSSDLPKKATKAKMETEKDEEDDEVLILDDGSSRPIPTREEIENEAEIEAPLVRERPLVIKDGKECPHFNKTPARLDANTKKVIINCRDCGVPLPYVSTRQRALEMNGKLPDDIKMNTSNKARSKRD